MAVITAEKLGATVGAQVHGVDRERLIGTSRSRSGPWTRWRRTGSWCSGTSTSTT